MSLDEQLAAAQANARPGESQLGELARASMAEQREDQVLPLLARAAEAEGSAILWQWKGALERALDEHANAIASFEKAQRLAPNDPTIAHGRARVALEAGLPAVELFVRALQLAPGDPHVYLGLNAARIAEDRAEEAEADLDRVLERSPAWLDGHHQLAQLRSQLGRRDQAFDSLERAIALQPAQAALWRALLELQVLAEDYPLLETNAERARRSGISEDLLSHYAFIAASELGQTSVADRLVKENPSAISPIWRVRHLVRSGRVREARRMVDEELGGRRAAEMWPYAATVWRLSGDARYDWLAGHPQLISIIDLSSEIGQIAGLAALLRRLHEKSGRYLNQSVRGGTQTDGPLFSRIDPEIRALRRLVVRAVENYSAALESLPAGHPQMPSVGRNRVRFAGSWSVRLTDDGFHTSHVHPRGWISSALYISLPDRLDQGEGALALGEPPPELGVDLQPTRVIAPKVGHLALFPSWMWHATRPFTNGERLTVAFDVAP